MTRTDRSRAECSSAARRRPAAASLLLALALLAGACGDAPQEAPDATTGTPGATNAEPDGASSPTPAHLPGGGNVEAGTYVLSAAPGGGFDASHRITISVPSGYVGFQGWAVLGPNRGLNFGIVDNVFADPCRWSGTLLDPPVGPRVDDLVAAMANQPGHATTPTDVTLDGYAGKQMELTAPADFADCDEGQIRSWTFAPGELDYRSHEPGEHSLLWILDVDGVRLVLEAAYSPGASAQDRAELLQMVESVRIDPL